MNHNIKSKISYVILGISLATSLGVLVIYNGNSPVIGQPTSEINIGNTTSEASDTFFQLDDSIQKMKSLVNETQTSLDSGNATKAYGLLNLIYNELLQISNNSNNLIWDLSNKGA